MLSPARDVADLVRGKIDMASFAQKTLEQFGGTEGLVAKLYEEYQAIPEGNRLRHEILKTILTLLERHSSSGPDDDELTEGELIAQRDELRREAILPGPETARPRETGGEAESPEVEPEFHGQLAVPY